MEFWGVEVKSGVSLPVDPGTDMILHISQVALGEKKNNGSEPVKIYLKVGDHKLVIGTLSHDKIPQLSTEIVSEKPCELSHSWKNGSVYFTGYLEDESEDEPVVAQPVAKEVNLQVPNEDVNAGSDEESSDDDTSEDSGDDEEKKVAAKVDSDEDDEDDSSDEDEDDSSDEDTPVKVEESKKRSAEGNTSKNPAASNKKAKFVTPEKSTESKKAHVHVATPHPSKQGGKNSASNGESSKQQQTPKSAGAFACKSCNRSFTSEVGLQSHTKAKHSAAA
ncbi:unnamed protein product [Microthlaspi erraticum]|uniref:C2H2-type domain-containing protein n=1 Tax=Microthlaspi erraticum TaxID=1685480 RepID=A0A6D2J295_9BRAS|nr:unnamed protein product [Microthlaspi erraticum]